MTYYVIQSTEDGIRIEQVAEAELTRRLNGEWYGGGVRWADKMPAETDPNYWSGASVIIKGELVTPKPVSVTTEWKLP